MAADNYRFAEGDSLLCYHGPMLYEAKCLKRRKANDGKAQYFIHYKGWNSKWEEWVDDNRVLSVNAANMNKMASLKEIHSNTKKSGGKRSIAIVKEETIRNVVTPPIKVNKRKYSVISSKLNQSVNVQSPTEPKQKKRGRSPKIVTSTIEETEVAKSVNKTIITENDVNVPSPTEPTQKKRGNKRKYSVISSKLNQSVNVPSPTEPKQKKRVRPPKIVTSKIEETEVTKSVDKTIVTEDDVITESAESVEENKVIDKITKQDTTKKQDNAKKQDTALILDSPKKENTLKKYNTTNKKSAVKKKGNSIKEDTLNKNAAPKKKDSLKKVDAPKQKDAPKKENKPKQKGSPKKEDNPEKVVVNNLIDEATEEILGSKKVGVIKNFEAAKEKKETTKTDDEEIKVNAGVENATEELEKTKTIEPCKGSKDIEETETIKEVENTLEKYNTKKKEKTLKEGTPNKDVNPKKKDILKNEDNLKQNNAPKKEDTPIKYDTSKKEDTPKKKDAPKKEDTPEELGVIKLMDEATEEIFDTYFRYIEATEEKKQTNNTADGEINVHVEVENASEELEKTKAVEPCEESKDIEETETIKVVEGSEAVERNEDIEESETENFESIENSEAEVHDTDIHEARNLEVGDPEGEDLEADDLEIGYLESENLEDEDTDAESLEDEYFELDYTDSDEESGDVDDFIFEKSLSRFYARFKQQRGRKLTKEAEMTASTEGFGVTCHILAPVIPKINIPDIIINRIAYDFHMVVHNNLFVKFRRELTVNHLIQDFESSDTNANNSFIGLTIAQYFNNCIHRQLLYPPEKKRGLRDEAINFVKNFVVNDTEHDFGRLYPRKIWHVAYGPSYLLRLFVLLPEIVANFSYIESDTVYLVKRLEQFMMFIANNFDQYFSDKFNDYCK